MIGRSSQVFTQNLVQSFDLGNSSRENLELPLFVYLLNGRCRHSAIAKLSEVRLFAKNPIISDSNDFRMKLRKIPRNMTHMKSDAWSVCRKIVRKHVVLKCETQIMLNIGDCTRIIDH